MTNPDFIYDPNDWEYTHAWSDRDEAADIAEMQPAEVKRFATLVKGPDAYCVVINDHYQWFGTWEDADKAWKTAGKSDEPA